MTEKKKAVVLLSGGLDSSTVLAYCVRDGFEPYAMSFTYGQRHSHELAAARNIAKSFNIRNHITVPINLRMFGGSALTDDIDVPKNRTGEEMSDSIPITYVPARNTIFLSYALGWAEVIGSFDIFIGVNAIDYSGYPDCRPEYIRAFERLAHLATKAGVEGNPCTIHAPLIDMSKSEIISLGHSLGVDYSLTHSCYDPTDEGFACGSCDSCQLRKRGFQEAGIADPTTYIEG
ncbi:7-cyano-7-deazaguanine synthase QueC [Candidatus Latescibacterota bacterium]